MLTNTIKRLVVKGLIGAIGAFVIFAPPGTLIVLTSSLFLYLSPTGRLVLAGIAAIAVTLLYLFRTKVRAQLAQIRASYLAGR